MCVKEFVIEWFDEDKANEGWQFIIIITGDRDGNFKEGRNKYIYTAMDEFQ